MDQSVVCKAEEEMRLIIVIPMIRFTWICFAYLSTSLPFEMSNVEACAWLFYVAGFIPVYLLNDWKVSPFWKWLAGMTVDKPSKRWEIIR